MKSQHIALPGLQAAALAFLGARSASAAAAAAAAAKVFCAGANNKVVADTNCAISQAPAPNTFMFNSKAEHPVGSTVDESKVDLYDAADMIGRQNARFPPDYEMETESFGKRQECAGGNRGG
ncbi:hypothetical protein CaCOL14_006117 [Colletotrichum acutatum]|uniref:Uncharacterized protein n=1 Tax=Glomerella acutata TaxID=27357 RepID=A0AAD8XAH6_GLOAC|nr:uncharacterized protein BDZ83DRAFT_636108 [Colletotrichum acutatum]KAK1714984.1 hypothetical protein BDZ83DRAFT_636108 [Colletotrichum acutatum]